MSGKRIGDRFSRGGGSGQTPAPEPEPVRPIIESAPTLVALLDEHVGRIEALEARVDDLEQEVKALRSRRPDDVPARRLGPPGVRLLPSR